MILFCGDSFTWGQGLEWEELLREGYSVEQINKLVPPQYACERLPIKYQDYRLKNHYPRLVAEHFNVGYDLSRQGNGGSNGDIYKTMRYFNHRMIGDNLDLLFMQFTHSGRHVPYDGNPWSVDAEGVFEEDIKQAVEHIQFFEEHFPNVKVVTLHWLPETGILLEKKLGEKYVIKQNVDGNTYYGFEEWIDEYTFGKKHEIQDYHFTSEGHRIMADNVIKHIEDFDLLKKNTFYENLQ